MSKYDKVPTDLKFVEREKEVEKFWKDNDIFQKLSLIHILANSRIKSWNTSGT